VIPTSLEERRAWVEGLNPADKLELRTELEKFSALPIKQQQALRQLDKQLTDSADSAQLHHIMQRYNDWLKTLSAADRANVLDESNAQDQIKLIRQLRQGQMGQAFAWLEPGLNLMRNRDNAAILQWMRDFAEKHEAELTEASSEQKRPDAQRPEDRRRRRPLAMLAWQEWWSATASGTPPVTPTDIHALHFQLSPEKQKQLDAEATLKDQVSLIRQWIQTASGEFREMAVQGFGRWGGLPNPDRLNRFEQQLSPEEKKELEGLSSVDRMRKLMELFQKHRMADFQRAGGPGPRQPNDSAIEAGKAKDSNSPPKPADQE
jgi:hypothetical protein